VIELTTEEIEAMQRHSVACAPDEACGLLAGRGSRVHMVYCLDNIAHSPVRFTVDPTGHMGALRHAEANGWDLIGAFHSHPHGPATPSRIDVAGALEADWYYVIVAPGDLGAYRIVAGRVQRVQIAHVQTQRASTQRVRTERASTQRVRTERVEPTQPRRREHQRNQTPQVTTWRPPQPSLGAGYHTRSGSASACS
jgi:proteasome lid subunit RPN8/RPN11